MGNYLPASGRGRVVITSRNPALSQFGRMLAVEPLSEDEAVGYLRRRLGVPDEAATRELARELARELDGVPLALAQAAAYIEQTGQDLDGYLTRYRQAYRQLLADPAFAPADHPTPVAGTYKLALERAAAEEPASVPLLDLCAFLPPEAIPLVGLVASKPNVLPDDLAAAVVDGVRLDNAIAALTRAALLTPVGDRRVRVHRLVQALTVANLSKAQSAEWAERAVELGWAAFPHAEGSERQLRQQWSYSQIRQRTGGGRYVGTDAHGSPRSSSVSTLSRSTSGNPLENGAVAFTQKRRYLMLRRLSLTGVTVAFLIVATALNENPSQSKTTVSWQVAAPGLVVAGLLGLLVLVKLPKTYSLILDPDHIRLVVGSRSLASYQWERVASVRQVWTKHKRRSNERATLVLRLKRRPSPLRRQLGLHPRLDPATGEIVLAELHRLATTPEEIERTLAAFAGDAWIPNPRISIDSGPMATSSMSRARFATERWQMALITGCLVIVGLSPLASIIFHRRIDLADWRVAALAIWSALLSIPAVLAGSYLVRPSALTVDEHGITFRRGQHSFDTPWSDVEQVAVVPRRHGAAPDSVLFLKLRHPAGPPAGRLLPRFSDRLGGWFVCDLYSLTTNPKTVKEVLSRFAGSAWTTDYYPADAVDIDDEGKRASIVGHTAGVRTFIAGFTAMIGGSFLIGVIPPSGPASSSQLSLSGALAALATVGALIYVAWICSFRRCLLTLDAHQVTLTVGRRIVNFPWHDIADIRIVREQILKSNKPPTYMHSLFVTFHEESGKRIRLAAPKWSLWPCCTWDNPGLRLVTLDAVECRLFATLDTIDHALKAFAGSHYLPPANG